MGEQLFYNIFRGDNVEEFKREALLLGERAIDKLKNARVAVFGVGGVGGYVAEALARCGVGTIDLIDNDVVSVSNINRQIIALHSTVGQYKVDAMAERIRDISPYAVVNRYKCFFLPENKDEFDFSKYTYVADAVDTVTAKISIIEAAKAANVPVISSMGAGNKLHPELFEVADLADTSVCPLAKVMRRELKKRGIAGVKVVYSKEEPLKPLISEIQQNGKQTPGSISFVPSVAGLIMAGEIIRDICK